MPESIFVQSARVLKSFAQRGPVHQLALVIVGIAASALAVSAMHYTYETFLKNDADENTAFGDSNPSPITQPEEERAASNSVQIGGEIQPVGIKNTSGSNCFLNAMLQVVIHTGLGQAVLNSELESDDSHGEKPLDDAFRQFFLQYSQDSQANRPVYNRKLMANMRKMLGMSADRQEDASEVFLRFFAAYKHQIRSAYEQTTSGKDESGAFHTSKTITPSNFIFQLPVNKGETLQQIWDGLKEERIHDKDNPWRPEGSGIQCSEYTKTKSFTQLPDALVFCMTKYRQVGTKNPKYEHITDEIVPSLTIVDSDVSGEKEYRLKAFIQHLGELDNGHYVAYVNKSGEWFLLNDSSVSPITESKALIAARSAYVFVYDQATRRRSGSNSSTSEAHPESPRDTEVHRSHEEIYQEFMKQWKEIRSNSVPILDLVSSEPGRKLLELGAEYVGTDGPHAAMISDICQRIQTARDIPELRYISFVQKIEVTAEGTVLHIPDDGNCLFGSFASACEAQGKIITSGKNLTNHVAARQETLDWMEKNQDEIPQHLLWLGMLSLFERPKELLEDEQRALEARLNEPFTDQTVETRQDVEARLTQVQREINEFVLPDFDFKNYLKELKQLKRFGGYIEIFAMSHAFKVPIIIVVPFGDSQEVTVWGKEFQSENVPVVLKFANSHYNALSTTAEQRQNYLLRAIDPLESYRAASQA